MENIVMFAPAGGALALLFALYLSSKISKAEPGTERMQEIAGHIHEGAMAFLGRQYRAIAVFVIAVFLILGIFLSISADVDGYLQNKHAGIYFFCPGKYAAMQIGDARIASLQ